MLRQVLPLSFESRLVRLLLPPVGFSSNWSKPDPPPPYMLQRCFIGKNNSLLVAKQRSGWAAAVVTLIKRLTAVYLVSIGFLSPAHLRENVTHKHKYVFIVYSQSRSEANIYTPDCLGASGDAIAFNCREATLHFYYSKLLYFLIWFFGCLPYLYLCHRVKEVLNLYSL